MDIGEGGLATACHLAAVEREIPARGGLPDVDEPRQEGHPPQHRVILPRLMRVAPAPAFDIRPEAGLKLQQRLVEGCARDVGAAFLGGGLHDVAPATGPVGIAEDPFDEERLKMGEFLRQRSQFVADQPGLQCPHPGGEDQRLRQMLVHLAVPRGQKFQRALAGALGRAIGGGFSGEPQIGADQRQEPARGGADRIELSGDEAVARMDLALAHEPRQALDPLAVAPIVADMVREGPFEQLVIRVDDDTARRALEARVGGEGQGALPAVARLPAGARHPALGDMARIAARQRAHRDQRHAILIGQRKVLHRGLYPRSRADRVAHAARAHQRHRRAHRAIGMIERRPGQRDHMARRGHGGEVEMAARQHRPVRGPAQRDGDRLGILHGDDRAAGLEVGPAIGGAIALGVLRVEFLDIEVLIVGIGRGQPPTQPRIAPAQHQRHAGNRASDHAARRKLQPCEIPDRRRAQPQMRVIGQQRAARRRAFGRGGEGVGRPRLIAPRKGREGGLGRGVPDGAWCGGTREQLGIARQRRDPGAGHRGQDVARPVLAQHRDLCAQHLGLDLGRELHRHQLQDRQRVGGRPIGDLVLEEPEFRRPTPARAFVHQFDPLVHPARIGLKRGARLSVLRFERVDRRAIKIEPAHQLVGLERLRSEYLRQPPLNGPTQQAHLPQPVLRMGQTQPEIHVLIGRAKDMRDVFGRADDLDGCGNAAHLMGLVIVRQRARGEIPQPQQHQHRRQQNQRYQPHHPSKHRDHHALALAPPVDAGG